MSEDLRRMLRPGETMIYNRRGGFTLAGLSSLGTHSLAITSQGRVLAHDTGGIFGTNQTSEYNAAEHKIKITMNEDGVKLENTVFGALTFSFTLGIHEFIRLFKDTPAQLQLFVSVQTGERWPCYMKGNGLPNDYTFGHVVFHKEGICFEYKDRINSNLRLDLYYYWFRSFTYEPSGIGTIEGAFAHGTQTLRQFMLFSPQLPLLAVIQSNCHKFNGVFGVARQTEILHFVERGYLNGGWVQAPIWLYTPGGQLRVVDKNSLTLLAELDPRIDEYFYDDQLQRLVVVQSQPVMVVQAVKTLVFELHNQDTIAFITKELARNDNRLYSDVGEIEGLFAGQPLNKMRTSVLIGGGKFRLFSSDYQFLFGIIVDDETIFLKDRGRLFIVRHDEISSLLMKKEDWLVRSGLSLEDPLEASEYTADIGFFKDEGSFIAGTEGGSLTFAQKRMKPFQTILKTDIQSINVIERSDISRFLEVELVLRLDKGERKSFELYLTEHTLERWIYETYHYAKSLILERVHPQRMMESWGRQLNDYVLYQYFGNLFALREAMKETIKQYSSNREKRNYQLINLLYYGILMQKRKLDSLTVYLPAMFEQEDRKLAASDTFVLTDQPYRQWRSSLISIQNQILRSLNELDTTLSSASGAIIPRKDFDNILSKKKKRSIGLGLAGGGTAITTAVIATGLSGGVLALLAVPALISGINNYLNAKDSQAIERIKLENEQNRYDFLVERVIGAFDHLMDMMLPYYISEMNRATFTFFQQTELQLRHAYALPAFKRELLQRLSRHYTFQQLPIDDSVVIPKKQLIAVIHRTVDNSEIFIRELNREATFGV